MPDYRANDPKGWCGDPARGAAMGRPDRHGTKDYAGRIHLRRVRLNAGGYDSNGTYFGHGKPLYWSASGDGSIDAMLRATDRDEAWGVVTAIYPRAKVRR